MAVHLSQHGRQQGRNGSLTPSLRRSVRDKTLPHRRSASVRAPVPPALNATDSGILPTHTMLSAADMVIPASLSTTAVSTTLLLRRRCVLSVFFLVFRSSIALRLRRKLLPRMAA